MTISMMPTPPDGWEWKVSLGNPDSAGAYAPTVLLQAAYGHTYIAAEGGETLSYSLGALSDHPTDIIAAAHKVLETRDQANERYAAQRAKKRALAETLGCGVI